AAPEAIRHRLADNDDSGARGVVRRHKAATLPDANSQDAEISWRDVGLEHHVPGWQALLILESEVAYHRGLGQRQPVHSARCLDAGDRGDPHRDALLDVLQQL